jgi:hypothetical protein
MKWNGMVKHFPGNSKCVAAEFPARDSASCPACLVFTGSMRDRGTGLRSRGSPPAARIRLDDGG